MMATMRHRPIQLGKICPVCGSTAYAEAKLPTPASTPAVKFDLDHPATLVEGQSLSLLLALVELLPYKLFYCARCGAEFKLESPVSRGLVRAMLDSMSPVLPAGRPAATAPTRPRPAPSATRATPAQAAPASDEWEVESLDTLLAGGTGAAPSTP